MSVREIRLEWREREIIAKLQAQIGTRREGRHLTDAIYCNVKAWGYARLETAGHPLPPSDEGALIRMACGSGLGEILEEGHVAQIATLSADDDTVGTIDVWWRGHANEIKVTWKSSRKTPQDSPAWMEQLGGYVARNLRPDAKTGYGEFWVIHLGGDQGKKLCLEHGVPTEAAKRKHPDSGHPRLICPQCGEFLADGDRNPTLRCYGETWLRADLESLHHIQTTRQARLRQDILNPDYQIGGLLPEPAWGFQAEFECKGCQVKKAIGCPGVDGIDDLEAQLEGSIMALEAKKKGST